MLRTVLSGLLTLIALGLTTVADVRAQTAPPAAPIGGGAPAVVRAGLNDVVATVVTDNGHTDKVTKGEVLTFVSRYPIPPSENRETVYRETIDSLINTKILTQFLARQKVPVPPESVDQEIEKLKKQLQTEGQDLASTLLQNGVSMDDVRKELENRIRWTEFLRSKATDAALRKFVADNRDLFSNTQVRASHILLKVEPNASEGEKEKTKQKLLGVKNDIEQNKITFAAAANKYSEDPANEGGAGGDLDYFSLSTGLIEEFTDVAFKLKKGAISGVIETPFGFHLIQVTDRKEGKPIDFEQNKPLILQAFASDLQKSVVTAERKTAKLDVKPMPKDLFPPETPVTPDPAAGAVEKTKAAGGATPKQ
jgi:peptidyl-prolyl cis-trans isomerase C